ncbi:MAG TPA: hypothetical protein VHW95_11155 [Steroidobacteraceae bacterium]|nr:hypothetical protein [Steroidobacteraceae bacterium]
MKTLIIKFIAVGRALGPYIAIELLLPGGSLIALMYWLYRTKIKGADLKAVFT